MTSPAVTVRDHATPQVAVNLLAERHVTMLPVVDGQGRLVGIVSEADLLVLPESPDPRAHLRPASSVRSSTAPRTVAELMTRSPQTTSERADAAEVATVFRRTAWKCLPVMRGDELVGVVSRSDIIRALSRDDDDIEDDVNRLLKDFEPAWEASVQNGAVTIEGSGGDRDGDAAASLAATVMGVRSIQVRRAHPPGRSSDHPSQAPAAAWSIDHLHNPSNFPPSSATGVDQL